MEMKFFWGRVGASAATLSPPWRPAFSEIGGNFEPASLRCGPSRALARDAGPPSVWRDSFRRQGRGRRDAAR